MVLKHSKALARKGSQRAFFRCEQVKKIEEKTCTHPRLRGVRWFLMGKAGLGAFPSVLEGFLLVFSLNEGSDPFLTPHPHPLDSCLGSGADRTNGLVSFSLVCWLVN